MASPFGFTFFVAGACGAGADVLANMAADTRVGKDSGVLVVDGLGAGVDEAVLVVAGLGAGKDEAVLVVDGLGVMADAPVFTGGAGDFACIGFDFDLIGRFISFAIAKN